MPGVSCTEEQVPEAFGGQAVVVAGPSLQTGVREAGVGAEAAVVPAVGVEAVAAEGVALVSAAAAVQTGAAAAGADVGLAVCSRHSGWALTSVQHQHHNTMEEEDKAYVYDEETE